jgi:hypothetical protein
VHEVVQKVTEPQLRTLRKCLIAALATGIASSVAFDAGLADALT